MRLEPGFKICAKCTYRKIAMMERFVEFLQLRIANIQFPINRKQKKEEEK